jgi:hypothetical protein
MIVVVAERKTKRSSAQFFASCGSFVGFFSFLRLRPVIPRADRGFGAPASVLYTPGVIVYNIVLDRDVEITSPFGIALGFVPHSAGALSSRHRHFTRGLAT